MKLTQKEVEKIVAYLDGHSIDLEIIISKDIELEQLEVFGYKFIQSDIVKGIVVTGGSFMASGYDISFDMFMKIITFDFEPFGIVERDAYGDRSLSYMPVDDHTKRRVLWHDDKSLIGQYDRIQEDEQ